MPTSARMLGTTSVASIGRGDLTPPLPRRTPLPQVCSNASVGGGLRPAPLGEVRFRVNFRYFGTPSPRVGADLCVRPLAGLAKTVPGPTHRSAPTDPIITSIKPKTTGGDRAPPLRSTCRQSLSLPAGDSSLCTREPWPAGDGGSAGCGHHPALRKHRNSQQYQAGRDGARWECRSAGRCTEGMASADQISFRNLGGGHRHRPLRKDGERIPTSLCSSE